MLNSFRQKGLTSAVYGLIIVATVVVFVVQFRPGAQGRAGSIHQECAAEVRGQCIDPKDYQAELMLVAPGRMVEAAQLRQLGIRRMVLDGLVERSLLVRDAERLGLSVSDDDSDNELIAGRVHVSLPVDRVGTVAYPLRLTDDLVRLLSFSNPETKAFDYKVYDRLVRQYTNRSPTEFKVMQRAELLAARMRDLIKQRVRVSDSEAWGAYVNEKSTATIRFVKFKRSWFATHALDTSPKAVDEWAKQHEDEVNRVFETRKTQYAPECRRVRHVLVKFAEGATDDEKTEARAKIDGILARAKRGEDFASLARATSDDTSAPVGGDLGCIQRGKMVKPFDDAAFALDAGQISPVVETQFGFHVIKVDAVLKDADAEAAGRRETAQQLMMNEEAETLAAETAKKVMAAARAGKKLDEALADALAALPSGVSKAGGAKDKKSADKDTEAAGRDDDRPKVEISGAFNAGGDPITGASPGVHAGQLAFKLEKPGDLADDLVRLDDGYAILELKEKTPATREQFDKERDSFIAAMTMAKQNDALATYIARLRDAAKGDVRLNDAFAKADEQQKQAPGGEEE